MLEDKQYLGQRASPMGVILNPSAVSCQITDYSFRRVFLQLTASDLDLISS